MMKRYAILGSTALSLVSFGSMAMDVPEGARDHARDGRPNTSQSTFAGRTGFVDVDATKQIARERLAAVRQELAGFQSKFDENNAKLRSVGVGESYIKQEEQKFAGMVAHYQAEIDALTKQLEQVGQQGNQQPRTGSPSTDDPQLAANYLRAAEKCGEGTKPSKDSTFMDKIRYIGFLIKDLEGSKAGTKLGSVRCANLKTTFEKFPTVLVQTGPLLFQSQTVFKESTETALVPIAQEFAKILNLEVMSDDHREATKLLDVVIRKIEALKSDKK